MPKQTSANPTTPASPTPASSSAPRWATNAVDVSVIIENETIDTVIGQASRSSSRPGRSIQVNDETDLTGKDMTASTAVRAARRATGILESRCSSLKTKRAPGSFDLGARGGSVRSTQLHEPRPPRAVRSSTTRVGLHLLGIMALLIVWLRFDHCRAGWARRQASSGVESLLQMHSITDLGDLAILRSGCSARSGDSRKLPVGHVVDKRVVERREPRAAQHVDPLDAAVGPDAQPDLGRGDVTDLVADPPRDLDRRSAAAGSWPAGTPARWRHPRSARSAARRSPPGRHEPRCRWHTQQEQDRSQRQTSS